MSLHYLNHGVFYAAAVVIDLHDNLVIATDIIKEAGLEEYDCSDLDGYEKSHLIKINHQSGIRLKGLPE